MAERAEVVIIGGGIMGASLAFALAGRGRARRAGAGAAHGRVRRERQDRRATAPALQQPPRGDAGPPQPPGLPALGRHRRRRLRLRECGLIATVATTGPDDPNIARMRANVALQNEPRHRRGGAGPATSCAELQPFARFDDIAVGSLRAGVGLRGRDRGDARNAGCGAAARRAAARRRRRSQHPHRGRPDRRGGDERRADRRAERSSARPARGRGRSWRRRRHGPDRADPGAGGDRQPAGRDAARRDDGLRGHGGRTTSAATGDQIARWSASAAAQFHETVDPDALR